MRALAAKWYQAGADGVYVWNLGTPFEYKVGDELLRIRQKAYACLDEIGDPKALVGKDKLYGSDGPVFHYYTFVSGEPPLPRFCSNQARSRRSRYRSVMTWRQRPRTALLPNLSCR